MIWAIRWRVEAMTFSDFLPTSWILFLWIALLIQARFESQRWLRAIENGALHPSRREEMLILLTFIRFTGQVVTWGCYIWYGWKVGWQPAVGLAVLANAVGFLTAPIPDSFLVWVVSSVAVIPLCAAALLTVYWI